MSDVPPDGPQLADLLTRVDDLHRTVESLRAEVRAALKAVAKPDGGPAHDNRRTAQRRNGRHVAVSFADPRGGDEEFTGELADFSAEGMSLVVDRLVPVGTFLTIRVADSGDFYRSLEVEVRNRLPGGPGHWRLGCHLTVPLAPDEMSRLGLTSDVPAAR